MKRLLAIFLSLLLLITATGCDSDQAEQAAWEGYPDVSFTQFLEAGYGGDLDPENPNFDRYDFRIRSEEGWAQSDTLDEANLSRGNKAYTYIVDYYHDNEPTHSLYFFMEYDKSTKQLKARGGAATRADGTPVMSSLTTEVTGYLDNMKQYQ